MGQLHCVFCTCYVGKSPDTLSMTAHADWRVIAIAWRRANSRFGLMPLLEQANLELEIAADRISWG